MRDIRNLLTLLKAELAFVEGGGYSSGPRFPWRPSFIFEDSPTCLNYQKKGGLRPCSDCQLMEFVPEENKKLAFPCRHIPLKPTGESVAHYYECGTEAEMEEALKSWLKTRITELEDQEKSLVHNA